MFHSQPRSRRFVQHPKPADALLDSRLLLVQFCSPEREMVEGWMELGNQIALSFSAEDMQVDSFGRQCLSNTLLNPLTITHSEEIKTHSYTVTPILTDSFRGI